MKPVCSFDRVVEIKVVSFQELPVQFSLKTYDGENSEIFRIDPVDELTAKIMLLTKLHHNADIQQYRLKVTAKEDISNLESTTDVGVADNKNRVSYCDQVTEQVLRLCSAETLAVSEAACRVENWLQWTKLIVECHRL